MKASLASVEDFWVQSTELLPSLDPSSLPSLLRVQVPNNKILRIWVIVIVVQVLGKYMTIGYLDP